MESSKRDIVLQGINELERAILLINSEIDKKKWPVKENAIYIASLMLRIGDLAQGIVVLLKAQNVASAKILIRTLSEAFVILTSLIQVEGFVSKYLKTFYSKKIKAIKDIKIHLNHLPNIWDDETAMRLVKENSDFLDAQASQMSDLKKLCEDLEMKQLYYLIFVPYSSYVHSRVDSLDDNVVVENEEYVLVHNKNVYSDCYQCLYLATDLYSNSYGKVADYLGYESLVVSKIKESLKEFLNKWKDIHS